MTKNLLEKIFAVPLWIMAYVPLLLLWGEYGHIPYPHYDWIRYAAAFVLFWGGAALFGWCRRLLKTAGNGSPITKEPPQTLVRSGPYRYSRNPMSVPVWMILFGEALYFNSLYLYGWAAAAVVLMTFYIVRFEEPLLLDRFGQRYMEYRADVSRFFNIKLG